jgi:hypothetical protein
MVNRCNLLQPLRKNHNVPANKNKSHRSVNQRINHATKVGLARICCVFVKAALLECAHRSRVEPNHALCLDESSTFSHNEPNNQLILDIGMTINAITIDTAKDCYLTMARHCAISISTKALWSLVTPIYLNNPSIAPAWEGRASSSVRLIGGRG